MRRDERDMLAGWEGGREGGGRAKNMLMAKQKMQEQAMGKKAKSK